MKFYKKNFLVIFILLIIGVIVIGGCIQETSSETPLQTGAKLEGDDCSSNTDCTSGVCDFIKENWGKCAPVKCLESSQAQGIRDIAFFCDKDGQWRRIQSIGEKCNYDYECYGRTGKDCPSCHPEDYKSCCKDNICVEEKQINDCEMQGLKRITSKEDADFNRDGSCIRTIEQRQETTVCAPCGNGICDTELESKCNCPEDCS